MLTIEKKLKDSVFMNVKLLMTSKSHLFVETSLRPFSSTLFHRDYDLPKFIFQRIEVPLRETFQYSLNLNKGSYEFCKCVCNPIMT